MKRKNTNRYERSRHYQLLRTSTERGSITGKNSKTFSHRSERRVINQLCHKAKFDDEVEVRLENDSYGDCWYRRGRWHWYGSEPEYSWREVPRPYKLQPKNIEEVHRLPEYMRDYYYKNLANRSQAQFKYELGQMSSYRWKWERELKQAAGEGNWEEFYRIYHSYAYGEPPKLSSEILGQRFNSRSEAHECALKHGTPRWFRIHSNGIVSEISYGEADTTSWNYVPKYVVHKDKVFVKFLSWQDLKLRRWDY